MYEESRQREEPDWMRNKRLGALVGASLIEMDGLDAAEGAPRAFEALLNRVHEWPQDDVRRQIVTDYALRLAGELGLQVQTEGVDR